MVKLKIIDDEIIYQLVKELEEAINKLNIKKIDEKKEELLKLNYDVEIDENELSDEFDSYIIPFDKLSNVENKQLNNLIQKAINEKKDILMMLGEDYD